MAKFKVGDKVHILPNENFIPEGKMLIKKIGFSSSFPIIVCKLDNDKETYFAHYDNLKLLNSEIIKESLWYYMEVNNREDQRLKDKMNELLDMLDSIKDLEP